MICRGQEGWTSDQHFTADGTLIEAWASLKSFVRKDGKDQAKVASAKEDEPGNPTINFHGEKRRNATHQSTTDPESVLYRKANGQASKLCFGTQVLMENRHGLCAAITVHNPIAQDEPTVALAQVDEHRELHEARMTTLGADKAYHQKKFVAGCREREVSPHAACKEGIDVLGTGWSHDRWCRLPHQPTPAQTGGRNLWLDENGAKPKTISAMVNFSVSGKQWQFWIPIIYECCIATAAHDPNNFSNRKGRIHSWLSGSYPSLPRIVNRKCSTKNLLVSPARLDWPRVSSDFLNFEAAFSQTSSAVLPSNMCIS